MASAGAFCDPSRIGCRPSCRRPDPVNRRRGRATVAVTSGRRTTAATPVTDNPWHGSEADRRRRGRSATDGLLAQLAGADEHLVLDLVDGDRTDRGVHPLAVLQHLAEDRDADAVAAQLAAEDVGGGLEALAGAAGRG